MKRSVLSLLLAVALSTGGCKMLDDILEERKQKAEEAAERTEEMRRQSEELMRWAEEGGERPDSLPDDEATPDPPEDATQ